MTTFFTMSYIIFVQPAILSATGMDFDSVMAATCLSSAAATLLMAFLANYPIALAPAMGHNVFFAFVVCQGMGIPWRTALGAVCISGLLFIALSAFGVRRAIMNLIPYSLKMAIGVGIGLMIALLGFQWAGVVVDNPATLIAIGSLTKPYVYVSGAGLLAASILIALRIRGAILIGMAVSAALGLFMGLLHFQGVYSAPPSLEPTFFQLQPFQALKLGLFTIIFVFLILDLFDTIGTLVAVAELGGFMKNGEMERAQPALLSDAIGTVFGALMGTSTVTSYVESSSGISDGARTGLASVVTAILFLLALFFAPLARMLGAGIELPGGATVYPVIAPALIVVGFMMMRAVKTIPWDDPSESIPAFLTIVLIAFSFSITEGIAFGVISYTVLKLATGRFKDLNVTLLILTAMFIFRYFFMKF
ncbi:MAG: NCS2 family permease [bacterium]|nr:NCS2 family permease [bacterium]